MKKGRLEKMASISDTIAQVNRLVDIVDENKGNAQLTDMIAKGEEAAKQMAALLGALKSGDTAAVKKALTEWDDVNELVEDSALMDEENAKGPGITLDEVLADTSKVLGVAAQVGALVLRFGPLLAL